MRERLLDSRNQQGCPFLVDEVCSIYGIEKKSERRKAIRTGTIHRIARVLKECNWSSLAEKMAHHDNSKAGNG